jgi:hypothetical protein
MKYRTIQSCLIQLALALCVVGELNAGDLPATLTPAPPAIPRVNGPGVFSVRPGSVFLYTVPATGDRPMPTNRKKTNPPLVSCNNRTKLRPVLGSDFHLARFNSRLPCRFRLFSRPISKTRTFLAHSVAGLHMSI